MSQTENNGISKDGCPFPAFAEQKKNGEIWLLVDYRGLNKVTVPMNHPNPDKENLLQGLNGSKYFSTMNYYKDIIKSQWILDMCTK